MIAESEVQFSDLDGDGRSELLIGYEISIARDSRLCLYRLSQLAMTELASYWYTDFLVSRVVSEAQNDVTVFHISNSEYVVEATLISMQNGEMKTRGKTFIDGCIEKFNTRYGTDFDREGLAEAVNSDIEIRKKHIELI